MCIRDRSDLRRQAVSRWALPQISRLEIFSYFFLKTHSFSTRKKIRRTKQHSSLGNPTTVTKLEFIHLHEERCRLTKIIRENIRTANIIHQTKEETKRVLTHTV